MTKFFLRLFAVVLPFFIFSDEAEVVFHKTSETLAKIMEIISKGEKGAYLRFGDGDINLATGRDDSYQRSNPRLQAELQQAFALNDLNVLKCLPIQCKELNGWEEGMFPGNHESSYDFSKQILRDASKLWGQKITDVYSPVAIHFAATNNPFECIEFLKFLRRSNCTVLVGNENIPTKIRELLFGAECQFIPTPPQQSYSTIDCIESDCLELLKAVPEYKIVITSMGNSGRALQKRLWYKVDNVFFFDFGSLMDALCGWNTRAWIDLSHFNKDQFIQQLSISIEEENNKI